MKILFLPIFVVHFISQCGAFFVVPDHIRSIVFTKSSLQAKDVNSQVEEYKNAATSILSNFMSSDSDMSSDEDPLQGIDFNEAKFPKVPIQVLAQILDYELYAKEWFVTGLVAPKYFADEFEFQDPDVKLSGIENYARAVNKLFDQETSRAKIISVVVNEETDGRDIITVTWRLSGKVNIGTGGGLSIKPYVCYTDLKIDEEEGLIIFQEDRFDIPQWDILLSAFFPFLIGKVTKPPAPDIVRKDIPVMPNISTYTSRVGIFDGIFSLFN